MLRHRSEAVARPPTLPPALPSVCPAIHPPVHPPTLPSTPRAPWAPAHLHGADLATVRVDRDPDPIPNPHLRDDHRLVVEPVAQAAQLGEVRHELGVAEHGAEDLAVRLLPEEHAAHVEARPGGIERRACDTHAEVSRLPELLAAETVRGAATRRPWCFGERPCLGLALATASHRSLHWLPPPPPERGCRGAPRSR